MNEDHAIDKRRPRSLGSRRGGSATWAAPFASILGIVLASRSAATKVASPNRAPSAKAEQAKTIRAYVASEAVKRANEQVMPSNASEQTKRSVVR